VIARSQAIALGVSKGMIQHRVATGRWEQLARDVFRVAGAPASWRQELMVATLGWGDGCAISHLAAAPLWRLAPFDPGPVELTVPRHRRRAAPGTVHQNALPPVDVTVLDGIPVTTPARTLIDVSSVVPSETVEEALDDALRRGLVTRARLRWRVEQLARPGRPGVTVIRELLAARDPGTAVPQSVLETKMMRLLRRARLPRPVAQHRIRANGRVVATVDFAYPDEQLAIEVDGYRWHSGRVRWEHDRARLNALTLLGWRVVHVTSADLARRPQDVIDRIRMALLAGRKAAP